MRSSSQFNAKYYIPFPCCRKEKQAVAEGTRGFISSKCPNCGKFAVFDLANRKAYPSSALRGMVDNLKEPEPMY